MGKFYVVWQGHQPGVYTNWDDCKEQVEGFPNAKYRAYNNQQEAVAAFRGETGKDLDILRSIAQHRKQTQETASQQPSMLPFQQQHNPAQPPRQPQPRSTQQKKTSAAGLQPTLFGLENEKSPEQQSQAQPQSRSLHPAIRRNAIAVDGACAGNPGPMEYRGVKVDTGEELFRVGPIEGGTNNIAEYLALVHVLATLYAKGDGETPVYSDSRTALAWLKRRGQATTLPPDGINPQIVQMLQRADNWLQNHLYIPNQVLKWDTDNWGEIPADFGRK